MKKPLSSKLISSSIFALLTLSCHASWVWHDDIVLPTNSQSGSFQYIPIGATYDIGNAVDSQGWDRDPAALNIIYQTTGNEGISFTYDTPHANGSLFLRVNLDPDNDNILPTELTIDVIVPFGIATRSDYTLAGRVDNDKGYGRGALGFTINTDGAVFDARLAANDAAGNKITLDNSYDFNAAGDSTPTSFIAGDAVWDNLNATWTGLGNNDLNHSTYFPTVAPTGTYDPTKALGNFRFTLSDFSSGESFQLSFDGSVAASSIAIPEASSTILSALGCLALLTRRKRAQIS